MKDLAILNVGLLCTQLHRLWFISSDTEIQPFLLSHQWITQESYVHYGGQHLFTICLIMFIKMRFSPAFKFIEIAELVYFLDYLLRYNEDMVSVFGVGIGIADFKFLAYLTVIWKHFLMK